MGGKREEGELNERRRPFSELTSSLSVVVGSELSCFSKVDSPRPFATLSAGHQFIGSRLTVQAPASESPEKGIGQRSPWAQLLLRIINIAGGNCRENVD